MRITPSEQHELAQEIARAIRYKTRCLPLATGMRHPLANPHSPTLEQVEVASIVSDAIDDFAGEPDYEAQHADRRYDAQVEDAL